VSKIIYILYFPILCQTCVVTVSKNHQKWRRRFVVIWKYLPWSHYFWPTCGHTSNHHHTTTILRPFFWDHPGDPEPEENFWTLWCKGRLTEADTSTIRTGATPSGLTSAHLHHLPIFYRPNALPAAQPTVSKH